MLRVESRLVIVTNMFSQEKEQFGATINPNDPPAPAKGSDRMRHEETENTAGWVTDHLVDDKWYRCPVENCSICFMDNVMSEMANSLVGQILTLVDASYSNEKQAKAVKDIVKNIVYTEKDRFELEGRRVVIGCDKPKQQA